MQKRYTKISIRTIDHILDWGKKLSRQKGLTKSDSEIYLLLTITKKDMLNKQYQEKKEFSADYPLGGSIEPYDIARDDE